MPATASSLHPAHAVNKLRMAQRLANFLTETGATELPAALATLSADPRFADQAEASWRRIAALAGEKRVPSPSTRAMVASLIEAPVVVATDIARLFKDLPR